MPTSVLFAIDLAAIGVLVLVVYFPRHRRRDMVVAFIGVNLGVLAVANALGSMQASAGLGLGLFGVLSIIRLRSDELDHREIAYYFAALALGLLGGLTVEPSWLAPALMAALVIGLYLADHPSILGRYRHEMMTLDRAYTDEALLVGRLEELLGAKVHRVHVRSVDLVDDTTRLEVRYQLPVTERRAVRS